MRSRHVLFEVWLNMAWKETLSEINIMAFSDERSLIQSFTQVRGSNNCYKPKTELQLNKIFSRFYSSINDFISFNTLYLQ